MAGDGWLNREVGGYIAAWGSMTFWYGSGCGSESLDPYLTNPNVDPGGPKSNGSYGFGTFTLFFKDKKS
jgi:hypothetical protein